MDCCALARSREVKKDISGDGHPLPQVRLNHFQHHTVSESLIWLLVFAQIWCTVHHIFGIDVSSEPELYTEFNGFACYILDDAKPCFCWEELLINSYVGTGLVASNAVLDEFLPNLGHQGKLVLL